MNKNDLSFHFYDKEFKILPQNIYTEKSGRVWIADFQEIYYLENNTWIDFTENLPNKESMWGNKHFTEDSSGNLYISCGTYITIIYDDSIRTINLKDYDINDNIISIAVTNEGTIWFSSFFDFAKFEYEKTKNIMLPVTDCEVKDIVILSEDEIMLATDWGLLTYKTTGEFKEIGHFSCSKIEKDINGIFWIAGKIGVYSYDGKNVVRYSTSQGLKSYFITTISVFDDVVWVLTDVGLSKIKNGKVENIEISGFPLNYVEVTDMIQDGEKNYWFNSDHGVIKMKNLQFEYIKESINDTEIVNFAVDKNGELWLGSKNCVYKKSVNGIVIYDINPEIPVDHFYKVYSNTLGEIIVSLTLRYAPGEQPDDTQFLGFYKYDSVTDKFEKWDNGGNQVIQDNYGRLWYHHEYYDYVCYEGDKPQKLNLPGPYLGKIERIHFKNDTIYVMSRYATFLKCVSNYWSEVDLSKLNLTGYMWYLDIADFNDKIYVTSIYGIIIIDNDNLTLINKANSDLLSDYVGEMYIDKEENIWFISYQGLSVYREGGVIIDVNDFACKRGGKLKTFPNPATNQLNILYDSEGRSTINFKIYNTQGDVVMSFSDSQSNIGENTKIVNIDKLESGMYFIKMYSDNDLLSEKIIIHK
jgi:hypothetical protein